MTLEDETGFVNVGIWESVFQRYSVLAKTVSFLGITGTLQVEDGVVHLVNDQTTGWLSEKLLQRVDAPGEFISYSEWDNQANIDKYRESQAHAEIQKHSLALPGGKASVKRYEVK